MGFFTRKRRSSISKGNPDPSFNKSPPAETVRKNVAFVSPQTSTNLLTDLTLVPTVESQHGGPLAACYSRSTSTSGHVSPQRASSAPFPTSARDHTSRAISPMSYASASSFVIRHQTPHLSLSQSASQLHTAGNSNEADGQIELPITWAQMADTDLVSNLGGRERTRQEVLWEIVASEERYVQELLSMLEIYVQPLLHPKSSPTLSEPSSPSATPILSHSLHSSGDTSESEPLFPLQTGSIRAVSVDHLPIAAKFARTLGRSNSLRGQADPMAGLGIDNIPHMQLNDSVILEEGRHTRLTNGTQRTVSAVRSSESPHLSTGMSTRQTYSPVRHHLKTRLGPSSKKLHRPKAARPEEDEALPVLPDDLRVILECISEHLVGRHEALSIALKERWRAQYPLVRTLADIWISQEWIVAAYSVYVLHLQKGLQSIEAALSSVSPLRGKRTNTSQSTMQEKDNKKLAKWIMRLEENGSARGESGLAICLSKPFQRLLKYPLLFQNLLYHTDASTAEYESTRNLAIEIDKIVKSIENEKISEEERDRIRDCWARIEGALMLPKSDRFLLDETSTWHSPQRSVSDAGRQARLTVDDPGMMSDASGDKRRKPKSNRRLSDMMASLDRDKRQPSIGSKRDIWLVKMTDVVLRCQRVGVTKLPMGSVTTLKQSKDHKILALPDRNLYKFLNVERWLHDSDEGLLQPATLSTRRREVSHGGTSRMSFSYAADEPRPNLDLVTDRLEHSIRQFKAPQSLQKDAAGNNPSDLTMSALSKRGQAPAKFAGRSRTSDVAGLPARSPTPNGYAAPTRASANRVRAVTPVLGQHTRSASPSTGYARNESGFAVLTQFWSENSSPQRPSFET